MRSHRRLPLGRAMVLAAAAVLLGAGSWIYLARPAAPPSQGQRPGAGQLARLLGSGPPADGGQGFARALAPRRFDFPADHGPHPRFRQEWWYFTGNVTAPDNRRFGYELTFFRIALSPKAVARPSQWGVTQLYMAHFAVTDVDDKTFHAHQRLERGTLGLAGARARPFRVWLDDWSAAGIHDDTTFPLRLRAARGGLALDLTLQQGKPVVLEGDRGLSRKGPAPGDASYYYSLTRMPTRGTLRVQGQTFRVHGSSWMDREWFTSALAPNQAGWDWFALQLSDGRELMFYRIRDKDGTVAPESSGTLVSADGRARHLGADDVRLRVLDHWKSPHSGVRYPSRWRLRLPRQGLALSVQPLLADQELNLAVTYWEGAVTIDGTSRGDPVSGRGYVEMTGYADGR